jgi:hypothetical protein
MSASAPLPFVRVRTWEQVRNPYIQDVTHIKLTDATSGALADCDCDPCRFDALKACVDRNRKTLRCVDLSPNIRRELLRRRGIVTDFTNVDDESLCGITKIDLRKAVPPTCPCYSPGPVCDCAEQQIMDVIRRHKHTLTTIRLPVGMWRRIPDTFWAEMPKAVQATARRNRLRAVGDTLRKRTALRQRRLRTTDLMAALTV